LAPEPETGGVDLLELEPILDTAPKRTGETKRPGRKTTKKPLTQWERTTTLKGFDPYTSRGS